MVLYLHMVAFFMKRWGLELRCYYGSVFLMLADFGKQTDQRDVGLFMSFEVNKQLKTKCTRSPRIQS